MFLPFIAVSLACAPSQTADSSEPAAVGSAGETACPYEENCGCDSPGITLRWRASYCMALNETGDAESEAVQSCLSALEPTEVRSLAACQKNAYWRKEICRLSHEDTGASYQRCLVSSDEIPAVIENGI